MSPADFTPDCARCAALCCVGLAFDKGPSFAFDKPAGEPCRNLDGALRCRIHDSLAAKGFSGCVAYDCQGAGQHVTGLFGGRSWRDDPALLEPMMAALKAMRAVQGARSLLAAARGLALPDAARGELEAADAALAPAGGWTLAGLGSGRAQAAAGAARAFLTTLAPYAARGTNRDGQALP